MLGKWFEVETDHKPLVSLLGDKHLDSLPPRLLRFRLRLDRFDYIIKHVPGKQLYEADTLSRTPLLSTMCDPIVEELSELLMKTHIAHLPASTQRLSMYDRAQADDSTCSLLLQYCHNGWPEKQSVDPMDKPYCAVRGELTVVENLPAIWQPDLCAGDPSRRNSEEAT